MNTKNWAVGGGLLVGLGAGFFFLPDGLAFLACLLIGLGAGLLITAITSKQ